jgi:hypothetical protein
MSPTPAPAAKIIPKPAKPVRPARTGDFAVLISSNLRKANALYDLKRVTTRGLKGSITTRRDRKGRTWHRVWVGCCTSKAEAAVLARKMRAQGVSREAVAMRHGT